MFVLISYFSKPNSMKKVINAKNAPNPVGPYNHSTAHNGTLYVSGQIAINPATGDIIMTNIEEETHQVLKNLGTILEAAGCTYEDVLKCEVFVKNMNDYGRINAVYAQYFKEDTAPARALVEVSSLPKYVNIEISCIAAMK